MFRSFIPALTLLVFGVGLGLGYSWSRGLIPLTIAPANSGTLSIEVTQHEPMPPPNDSETDLEGRSKGLALAPPSDDSEIFEEQSEPEVDRRSVEATNVSDDADRARMIRRKRETEASRSDELGSSTNSTDEPPVESKPVRLRNRNAVQIDSQAGIEEAPPAPRARKIVTTAHQDPTEAQDDGHQSTRDKKEVTLSPREQLAAAEDKLAAGETLAAHRDLSKLYWNHKELRPQFQETIDSSAHAIFFQSKPNYIEPYVVQEGDQLKAIAKKYQLSWEYLAKLNKTDPRRMQINQKLKVVKGPFAVVVDLQEFALTVHLQGYYVKRYNVGIGQDGSSPVGKFSVLNKVENPQYTGPDGKVIAADDPSNPLGERWIDLGDSYGIHGTIDPGSIGKAKSRGCIRLADKDIIEVYDFLVKGSEVVIRK